MSVPGRTAIAAEPRLARAELPEDDYDDEDVSPSELTPARIMAVDEALELLRHARLTVEGQLVDASNATLYVRAELDGVAAACAYKPVSGERPLWDFPDGTLAEREVAAHLVSSASGWDIVPPTILRDGPFGPGMLQLWIDTDDAVDIRSLLRQGAEPLRRVAVLDAMINNADRKGGHLLPVPSGHVYGIDHGIAFNVEDKLRTVIWNWAGEPLTDDELEVVRRLRADFDTTLAEPLSELLTVAEVRRTRRRMDFLLQSALFPQPSSRWPPVPWPAM